MSNYIAWVLGKFRPMQAHNTLCILFVDRRCGPVRSIFCFSFSAYKDRTFYLSKIDKPKRSSLFGQDSHEDNEKATRLTRLKKYKKNSKRREHSTWHEKKNLICRSNHLPFMSTGTLKPHTHCLQDDSAFKALKLYLFSEYTECASGEILFSGSNAINASKAKCYKQKWNLLFFSRNMIGRLTRNKARYIICRSYWYLADVCQCMRVCVCVSKRIFIRNSRRVFSSPPVSGQNARIQFVNFSIRLGSPHDNNGACCVWLHLPKIVYFSPGKGLIRCYKL